MKRPLKLEDQDPPFTIRITHGREDLGIVPKDTIRITVTSNTGALSEDHLKRKANEIRTNLYQYFGDDLHTSEVRVNGKRSPEAILTIYADVKSKDDDLYRALHRIEKQSGIQTPPLEQLITFDGSMGNAARSNRAVENN